MVAFGLVCLFCAVLGLIALAGMAKINRSSSNLAEIALPSSQALSDMASAMQIARRADMGLLLCDSTKCVDDYIQRRQTAATKFRDAESLYMATPVDDAQRTLVETTGADFGKYQDASNTAVALIQGGQKQAAQAQTVGANAQLFRRADGDMAAAEEATTHASRQLCLAAVSTYQSVRLLVIAFLLATILLSGVVGWLLTRSIAPPLARATEVLEAIAVKDLTKTIALESRDEIGRVSAALNAAMAALRQLVQTIQHGVGTLGEATAGLQARASQCAADSESHSRETSQIASAMQEMSATIAEVSQNAERATQSSRTVAQSAADGGAAMERTVQRMRDIGASSTHTAERMESLTKLSEQIGHVVVTIREISEQTNLLALNAAIEAQRAGEHGRGFAVVAGEVRRLAERTKSATEEITGTIATIQKETHETLRVMQGGMAGVTKGIEESEEARRVLETIITLSGEAEEQIAMIATASTEQAAAGGEISRSLTNISEVSTALSGAAKESTDESGALSRLAEDLSREVNSFAL